MTDFTGLIIQKAEILLPDGNLFLGDVLIKQGRIAQIASSIDSNDVNTILEASGLTLLLLYACRLS